MLSTNVLSQVGLPLSRPDDFGLPSQIHHHIVVGLLSQIDLGLRSGGGGSVAVFEGAPVTE